MKFRTNRTGLLAVFLVCVISGGCKKEILLPDLEGSMVGYVYTFDEFANLLEDHSDVLVSAFGMGWVYHTYTSADGRFEFKDLPAGTYELHIEKQGFGTLKQFGIKHLGGKPTILGITFSGYPNGSAFFLYHLTTTQIVDISIEADTLSGDFIFSGEPPEYLNLLIYLSNDPGFTNQEARYIVKESLWESNGKYQTQMTYGLLSYEPGERVYGRAYVFTWRSHVSTLNNTTVEGIDNYFDYESNQTVFPNTGDESSEFSFIIPE